jgi:hypothetical protein
MSNSSDQSGIRDVTDLTLSGREYFWNFLATFLSWSGKIFPNAEVFPAQKSLMSNISG